MAKKQLIMEKALELFAKQGFESTSVQQITEHCGISKGAFYLSFKSKDELILELLDHFTMQDLLEIDYLVRNTENETLLYDFYQATFDSFQKHSDFAKIFLKEQMHTLDEKFVNKMRTYEKSFEEVILTIVERLYREEIKEAKYDLIYCIKGFLNTYSQILLFSDAPVDLELLSQSLVEKTNILARHTTIPFITKEIAQVCPASEKATKEQILELIQEKMEEMEDSIEKESLVLLKEHLLKPALSPAIVKGLLENIRHHPHCKWISYLLRRYWEM
ncbi:TetR/AcrR family transcriptional regulator [Siminovitchia fortis]|uniref:TetR/AcrR family transcriptional regulator n=1 Tax=Siminovitchia fortis TaxID=254758 RepID=A0A451GBW9_9BACI|nr:TetR/AcrR family transcriptional regulator [Siminovitchia fortis]RWR12597.1 TetR/AcrR family transcriptional regulator [Siminovitchia fortis]WHY81455.1 TetR/AcrR family transcriptional regulator [Siminovitchia fortis]